MAVEIIGKVEDVRRYREHLHKQGILTKRFIDSARSRGVQVVKKPEDYRIFNGRIKSAYGVKTGADGVETRIKKLDPDARLFVKGLANANIVDRMDERVEPAGMEIESFMKNPVLLLDHLYVSGVTVGKVIALDAQADGVHFEGFVGDPTRAPLTQAQIDTRSLVAQKLLQTVSIGFIPHKVQAPVFDNEGRLEEPAVILAWELLELSIVAVPANAGAVFEVGNLGVSLNDSKESKRTFSRSLSQGKKDATININKQETDSTKIQTLIFDKEIFTEEEAKDWAKENDFKADNVDETDDSYRLRQKDPSDFEDGSFKTIELTEGVKAVIGKLKKSVEDERAMEEKLDLLIDEMKGLNTTLGQVSETLGYIKQQNEKMLAKEMDTEKEDDEEKEDEDKKKGGDKEEEDKEKEDKEDKEDDEKSKSIDDLKNIIEKQNETIENISGIMLQLAEKINKGDRSEG